MLKRRQMHYLISLRIGLLPQQSHISLSIGLDRLHMDSQGYFLLKFLGNLVWSKFRPYIKMCFITAQWSTARQRNHKETIGFVWIFFAGRNQISCRSILCVLLKFFCFPTRNYEFLFLFPTSSDEFWVGVPKQKWRVCVGSPKQQLWVWVGSLT